MEESWREALLKPNEESSSAPQISLQVSEGDWRKSLIPPPVAPPPPSIVPSPVGSVWKNRKKGEEGIYATPLSSSLETVADIASSMFIPEAIRRPIKQAMGYDVSAETTPTDLLMDAFLYTGGGGLTSKLMGVPKVSRVAKGAFKAVIDPALNEAGHVPGMHGIANIGATLGDKAWNALKPVRDRLLNTNLIKEGKVSEWMGGRNIGEWILPASSRMEPMAAGAFRKAEVAKGLSSSIAESKVAPLLKTFTPEERIGALKFLKTGEIPEGLSEEGMHGLALLENYKERIVNRPSLKYKPAYQNILKHTFDSQMEKVLDYDDAAMNLVKQSLASPSGKAGSMWTETKDLFKYGRGEFKVGQKALRDIIENPLTPIKAKEMAITIHDLPATLPRDLYESYKTATNVVLHRKILNNKSWSSSKPKEGFIASDRIKGPGGATVWVDKNIEQGLDELHYVRTGSRDFFNKYFTNPWKMVKVVMRMPTQFRNIMGNVILNDLQGPHPLPIYRPDVYIKSLNELIKGTGESKLFREITGLDTSTFIGAELGRYFLPMKHNASMVDHVFDTVLNNPISRKMADFYQFSEKWAKYSKFKWNLQHGMTDLDASIDAVRSTFDYNDVSIFTRKMRETAMPFFTWKAKVFAQLPEAFVKHPIRVSKYLALPAAVTSYALDRVGTTEEEWEEIKKVLPEYTKRGQLMLMPFRDSSDRLQFMNLSWLLPGIGDITELSSGFADPRQFMQNPLLNLYTALKANKDQTTGQPLWYEWEPTEVKLGKALYYPIKQLTPGWLPGGTDFEQVWNSVVKEDPETLSPSAALVSQFGLRMMPVNVEKLYQNKQYVDSLHMREIKAQMNRELRHTSSEAAQERIIEKYNNILQDHAQEVEKEEAE